MITSIGRPGRGSVVPRKASPRVIVQGTHTNQGVIFIALSALRLPFWVRLGILGRDITVPNGVWSVAVLCCSATTKRC
jgi:hypothetical protein